VFFAWMLVLTLMLIRAIRHQEAEERDEPADDLAAEVAKLRAEVAALRDAQAKPIS
jgi:hypothetical protein